MNLNYRALRRPALAVVALLVATFPLLPALVGRAYAYGQVTTRSIQMSSSAAGATGLTYTIKFTTATAGTVHGIVINFCDDNPLIGNSCGWTSGESIDLSSASFTSITGTPDTTVGASNWKISANSNSGTAGNGVILALTDTNAAENPSISASTAITIVIGGVKNPNYSTCGTPDTHPNCSFYGRILTYAADTSATGYASQAIGTPIDAGGDAMSTNSTIAITANVMEQLTFCISANSALVNGTNLCNSGGGVLTNPAITIGHGTPTPAIDSSAVDINYAYTQLSTNASGGAKVLMKSSNSCANGGLSSSGGATCGIPGIGSTATALTAGTANWGMCVNKGANTTVTSTYNDTANSCPTGGTYTAGTLVGMNGTNVNSTNTYGDQIFSTAGAVYKENNTLGFAATAALTTPAGVYTANENLVATGTF